MRRQSEEQLGLGLDPPSTPKSARPRPLLPDEAERDRITGDLETDLLVEAGAGSGKTTALVSRMVALVRTGTAAVHEVAAVTFTRKAAGELRQRFQEALEKDGLAPERTSDQRHLLDRALQNIDQAFMGTIHAFCARLLRERPLEAGVDPAFAGDHPGRGARPGGSLLVALPGAPGDPGRCHPGRTRGAGGSIRHS